MNFKFNPRQIFIRQINAERMLKQALDEIPYWNDKLKDESPEEKYLYYLQVDSYWMLIKLYYTVGEDIEKLPPLLEQLIESAEIGTKVWQENKPLLGKEEQNTPPYEWHNALNYLSTLGYISMCYLLQREDLLERLLKVIVDNSVYTELDAVLEDLFYFHLKDRPELDWAKYKYVLRFLKAMRTEGEEQLTLLHQYMKDWYKEMVGLNDIEHDTHLTEEQYGYYGYWAFEVAAVIYLEDLDDSSFTKYPYYPKDLVDWAKAKRREREGKKTE
ncbi:PoNe immunity protein domain-containing protein [Actinobacillus porcinus]|uniref:PoNe immunity protein domain-containing protein n=1 Tax=Actinobacillus porcinus TaxID=51048 RepID=UPI002354A3CA|nr:PoNe immunity protein domain-containing protein [Actinobacillus porcinus]